MEYEHPYNRFKSKVEPALTCKLDEFSILGYDHVKEHDLWLFLTKKKWKRPKEDIHLFEIVDDILSLAVGEFMTFSTVEAFKQPSWFSEEGQKELKDLLT